MALCSFSIKLLFVELFVSVLLYIFDLFILLVYCIQGDTIETQQRKPTL